MTGQVTPKLPQNYTKTMKIKTKSLEPISGTEVVFSQYFIGIPWPVVPFDGLIGIMQWEHIPELV